MIDPIKLGIPPGLVGDLAEWINATAGKPQPVLALAASLTYVGALGGRLYQGPCGERTNLYCLGVGPSCSGKEHARTQIKRLNKLAGVMNLMGGEDVTSDAAIEMELARQSRVLYLWDEVGHMFGNIKDAAGNGHRRNIIPMLMKLYSCANKTYEGKSYADRDSNKARRVIEQPCCCLYGTTVPERLFDALDRGQLLDGFLSRCLLFETTETPAFDRRRAMDLEVPDSLVEQVARFADMAPPMAGDGSDGDLVAPTIPDPEKIGLTGPAMDILCDYDAMVETLMERERNKQSGFDSLWGRASENATKIALVVAVGCQSSVIDEVMMTWARDLTTALIVDLKDAVDKRVADNAWQRNRQRVLDVITDAGEAGATKSEITRKTANLKAMERNQIIDELLKDFCSIVGEPINGTPGSRYWLAKYDKTTSVDV